MKKTACMSIFCAVLAALCMMSCAGESKLKKLVEEVNSACPYSLGMVGEMTGAEVTDDGVMFCYEMNEDLVSVEKLSSNVDLMKQSLRTLFANAEGELAEVVKELAAENASLKVRFTGKTSGAVAETSLTADEIREASSVESKDKDPKEIITESLKVTRSQCPQQVEEGITMTDVDVNGENVVYEYEVDEGIAEMDLIIANKQAVRANVLQNLHADDMSIRMFVDNCKKAGLGLSYRYVGSQSGKTMQIDFSIDEL